jgi:hypothetical protein
LIGLTRTRRAGINTKDDTPGPLRACCRPVRRACYTKVATVYSSIATLLRWYSIVCSSTICTQSIIVLSDCIEQHIQLASSPRIIKCHVLPGYEQLQVRPDGIICYHTGRALCHVGRYHSPLSAMIADRLGQWLHAVCSVQAWWHDAAFPPKALDHCYSSSLAVVVTYCYCHCTQQVGGCRSSGVFL